MTQNEQRICRLCLKVSRHDFEAVEWVTRDIFNVLLLKTDFSLSESPVMCANCADSIRKFFEFKSTCLFTEDRVVNFANTIDNSKIDPLEVAYMDANPNTNSTLTTSKVICRFCLHCIDKDICIALDTLEEDFQRDVLAKCIPEIDLSITKNPAICTACMESLMGYYNFMTTCLDVDKNISDYRQSQGLDNEMDRDSSNAVEIKVEDVESTIKNEEIEIEMENTEQEFTESSAATMPKKMRRRRTEQSVPGDTVKPDKKCVYITAHKSDIIRHVTHNPLDESNLKIHCIKRNHTDPSQQTIHRCQQCTYSTSRKGDLKSHMLRHVTATEENSFKCPKCSFKTVRKLTLQRHILTHLDRSKHNTFKCEYCPYSTCIKINLSRHKKVHANSTEEYRCELCVYKTKRKENLTQHMYVHLDNRQSIKCDVCEYKTRYKAHLIRHTKVHRKSDQGKCSFKGKNQVDLKDHMSSHKKDTKAYLRCASCSYQTKSKPSLIQHIVFSHKRERLNVGLFETVVDKREGVTDSPRKK